MGDAEIVAANALQKIAFQRLTRCISDGMHQNIEAIPVRLQCGKQVVDVGIMLNIEPKLYGKDQVATKVQAEISQLDKANQVGEYPAFKTRRTENDVQLRVGETLVLSGLVTEDSQSSNEGLAWLKDLPFIGGLFRNKSFKGNRTELVIFITPRLLTDAPDSVNAEEIKRQGRMIERYRKSAGAVELID